MLKKIILTCSAVFIFGSAYAATWVDKSGKAIPDSPSRKSSQNFIAQLILTDNEPQLFKNWDTLSKDVFIPTTNTIEKGKILSAFIVFGGCATDSQGNCDLMVQYKIYQPDGKVYANLPPMEVWSGKPVPPHKSLGLGVGYLRVIIEPEEPLGQYKVDAKVTDRRGRDSVKLSTTFNAIENK